MLNPLEIHNGFSTLGHIDQRLQQTRQLMHEIESKAEQTSQRLAQINNQESEIFTELAAIRLDALDDVASLRSSLSRAESQARELLEQRDVAIAQLVTESETSLAEQTRLEQQRETQAKALEDLAAQLHAKVEITHARLAEDSAYQAAQKFAQAETDKVNAANEKAMRSSRELQDKAAFYDADKLFSYLWKRGYGTQSYRAGRLARMCDQWLADHIGYEESRRNYYMLQEIPKRLNVHVASLRAAANDAMAALESLEHAAEIEDGVIALEQALEKQRQSLEQADRAIEHAENHYAQCLSRRDEYARAEDKFYKQALATLSNGLKNQSLDALRREARMTEGYDDDSLVGRLGELRLDKQSIEEAHLVTQQSSRQLAERLHGLERVRRDFKQRRFDAPHSQFNNGAAVSTAVDDFAGGLIGVAELWRIIERSQRFIRRRTYSNYAGQPGAMRLPRGIRIPSNWGGMGGGGGFKIPSGRSGGGGFRTGGGF